MKQQSKSADVVLHPAYERAKRTTEYIQANEDFITNFPAHRIYDEGSHDVVMNVLTGISDRLKFIELEDHFRKHGIKSAKNHLLNTGEIQIRHFLLKWEIVCLDENHTVVTDPIENGSLIDHRRLQLTRLFAHQVNDLVKQKTSD